MAKFNAIPANLKFSSFTITRLMRGGRYGSLEVSTLYEVSNNDEVDIPITRDLLNEKNGRLSISSCDDWQIEKTVVFSPPDSIIEENGKTIWSGDVSILDAYSQYESNRPPRYAFRKN